MTLTKKHLWTTAKWLWLAIGIFLVGLFVYGYIFLIKVQNLGEFIIGVAFFSYALGFLLIYLGINLIIFIIWAIKKQIKKLK